MKKRNMGKMILSLCMIALVSVSSVFPALADWEQQTDGNWRYKKADGSYAENCLIDGHYLNGDGIWMVTPELNEKGNIWDCSAATIEEVSVYGYELKEAFEDNGVTFAVDNPLIVSEDCASLNSDGDSTDSISLTKEGCIYKFQINDGMEHDYNQLALKQLCRLTGNSRLYSVLMEDYTSETYQADLFTQTGYGFSIMVHRENGCLTYYIKMD